MGDFGRKRLAVGIDMKVDFLAGGIVHIETMAAAGGTQQIFDRHITRLPAIAEGDGGSLVIWHLQLITSSF